MLTTKSIEVTVGFDGEESNIRITDAGFLAAEPRVSRTGIQMYTGSELGVDDKDVIHVMRPENVVFDAESMKSYAYKPITLDHPTEQVDAKNWKEHSVGTAGGDVVRDGEYVRVPLLIMDQAAIDAVQSGRSRELSLGYDMTLDFDKSGEGYDATVTSIRANHIALVSKARGGPMLKIGDKNMDEKFVKMTVDGVGVYTDETGADVIQRHIDSLTAQVSDAQTKIAERDAKIKEITDSNKDALDARDATIKTLETQLKDSRMSEEELDEAWEQRNRMYETAVLIGRDNQLLKGMKIRDMKRVIVADRMGEEDTKAMNDRQVDASFDVIRKDLISRHNDAHDALSSGQSIPLKDAVRVQVNVEDGRRLAQEAYEKDLFNPVKKETV